MLLLINRLKQDYPVLREPVEPNPQLAAVMVLLYEKKGLTHIILIRRSYNLKRHGGEIGFPGGLYETIDEHLLATALRETREELNLCVEESLVIGRLPAVTTRTGFQVTPFVALIDHEPKYSPNDAEVEEVYDIPLIPLLGTQAPDPSFKVTMDMIVFWYRENRIWGATAKILRQLARLKTH